MTERTDRELLELAARSAKLSFSWDEGRVRVHTGGFTGHEPNYHYWNPLTDDGDALRLAVKLHIKCFTSSHYAEMGISDDFVIEDASADPYAATRRAIVRAAAEIGAKP